MHDLMTYFVLRNYLGKLTRCTLQGSLFVAESFQDFRRPCEVTAKANWDTSGGGGRGGSLV